MKHSILLTLSLISLFGIGQTIEQIGSYNNGTKSVCTKDNFMIVSSGDIVDITDPTSPTLISQISGVNGDESQVIIDDNYAFIGTMMTNDLFIVDISNISSPLVKSTIDFNIGNGVFGMDISENTLFTSLGSGGTICSIDISDKNYPIMLDTLYIPDGQCRDIVVQNNYAYVSHHEGLKIIDISNPSELQLITSIGSGYNSIDINDNHVFLGKSSGGIDVFDISNPMAPIIAYSIPNIGETVWDLKYHEDHLYLATNSSGLYVYKIEENEGFEMGNFQFNGYQTFGVCVQDSLVLLTGLGQGTAILQYNPNIVATSNSIQTNNDLTIHPNPSKDFISITKYNYKINRIIINDYNGKFIKQIDFNNLIKKINISDLSAGEYIFVFETNDNIITKKIIKID